MIINRVYMNFLLYCKIKLSEINNKHMGCVYNIEMRDGIYFLCIYKFPYNNYPDVDSFIIFTKEIMIECLDKLSKKDCFVECSDYLEDNYSKFIYNKILP